MRVSALVVTYNHGRFVADALQSALGQSDPPEQIVVVDDGSSDDTVAQARGVGDPRIKVIELPHRGLMALAATYDRGLAECTGDLIALLEGDDLWPTDKLARQRGVFSSSDVVVSHGPYAVIGARGAALQRRVGPGLRLPRGRYDALPRLLRASYIMPVTTVLRRTALDAIGGFRQLGTTPHFDHPTFLALAERGLFHYQDEVVGIWRRHGGAGTFRLAGRHFEGVDLSRELALEVVGRLHRPDLPNESAVRRSWDDAYGHMVWQSTRILLLEGRRTDAWRILRPALGRGCSLPLRARLLLATAAAALHVSVEPLARLVGGRSSFEELD